MEAMKTAKTAKRHLVVAGSETGLLLEFCSVTNVKAETFTGTNQAGNDVTCRSCGEAYNALAESLNALGDAGQTPEQARDRVKAFAQYDATSTARSFNESLDLIERRLLDAVEDIRRERARTGERTAVQLAEQVMHTVLWMTPNLNLDSMVRNAGRLDRATRMVNTGVYEREAR